MNILIHDLETINEERIFKNGKGDSIIISNNGKIHPCICCFGCMVKTPGRCIINDGYENMGALFSRCGQVVIISECFYGSYSPFAHTALDRSFPHSLPYFETRKGLTHHKNRYGNNIILTVCFYGTITDAEKETAEKLVQANGINHYAQKAEVFFYKSAADIQGIL